MAGCATAPATGREEVAEPYIVEFGSTEVSLAILEDGAIPMHDFVKIAQRVTGRVITYRADDFAGLLWPAEQPFSDATCVLKAYRSFGGWWVDQYIRYQLPALQRGLILNDCTPQIV